MCLRFEANVRGNAHNKKISEQSRPKMVSVTMTKNHILGEHSHNRESGAYCQQNADKTRVSDCAYVRSLI